MLRRLAWCAGLLALLAGAAQAQPADTILLDGKIVTFDSAPAEALAVRGDRIIAVGRSADIRTLAGPATRVIDLAGRTVIPGLIDSHIHAIRAGLTWTTEVHWIGARSLAEALDRLARGRAGRAKGELARRRRRLDREPVRRAPPPDPGRDRGRGARSSCLCAGALQRGAAQRRRDRGARAAERCRAGVTPEDRDRRRRQADRLDQRRQPQHQRPVRQAAAADARAAGRRHARVLPHAQQPRHHRRARSRRLQHADRSLPGAVCRVARARADASASPTACARRAATTSLRISRR